MEPATDGGFPQHVQKEKNLNEQKSTEGRMASALSNQHAYPVTLLSSEDRSRKEERRLQ